MQTYSLRLHQISVLVVFSLVGAPVSLTLANREAQGRSHLLRGCEAASPAVLRWGCEDQAVRCLLRSLPASVFDATTDGMNEEEKERFVVEGRVTDFVLDTSNNHAMRVAYPNGEVDFHRFDHRDGASIVVVMTRNGENSSLAVFRLPPDAGKVIALPLTDVFPTLQASDFFPDPGTPAPGEGSISYSRKDAMLEARWMHAQDGEPAGDVVYLRWMGTRFQRDVDQ